MDHTPFIVAAYGVTTVVLLWCALSPVIRLRRLRRELAARNAVQAKEHA